MEVFHRYDTCDYVGLLHFTMESHKERKVEHDMSTAMGFSGLGSEGLLGSGYRG